MSHFSLLVITDTKPDQDELQRILLPWHEHECTGLTDYCVWVDKTDELRADWETKKDAVVVLADGTVLSRYDNRFWSRGTDPFAQQVFTLPAGAREDERPTREMEPNFEAWAKDYDGAEPIPGKPGRIGRFTNPNKQWDWWVVGGRWRGWLRTRAGAPRELGALSTFEKLDGEDPVPENRSSQAQAGEIDLAAWRDELGATAAGKWDRVHAALNGHSVVSWSVMRERHKDDIEMARTEYHAQPGVKAVKDAEALDVFEELEPFLAPRESYIETERNRALVPFAVVMDGKWHEKGDMGWWGVVRGEKDQDDWNAQVAKLLDGLPAEKWLTVVDCHI
jgi:hypothetical protein